MESTFPRPGRPHQLPQRAWLLESGYAYPGGYVDQYFTAPPNTPGWNTPLYGQFP